MNFSHNQHYFLTCFSHHCCCCVSRQKKAPTCYLPTTNEGHYNAYIPTAITGQSRTTLRLLSPIHPSDRCIPTDRSYRPLAQNPKILPTSPPVTRLRIPLRRRKKGRLFYNLGDQNKGMGRHRGWGTPSPALYIWPVPTGVSRQEWGTDNHRYCYCNTYIHAAPEYDEYYQKHTASALLPLLPAAAAAAAAAACMPKSARCRHKVGNTLRQKSPQKFAVPVQVAALT